MSIASAYVHWATRLRTETLESTNMKLYIIISLALLSLLAEPCRAGLTYTTNAQASTFSNPDDPVVVSGVNQASSASDTAAAGNATANANATISQSSAPAFGAAATAISYSTTNGPPQIGVGAQATVTVTDLLTVLVPPNEVTEDENAMVHVNLNLHGALSAGNGGPFNASSAAAMVTASLDIPYTDSSGNPATLQSTTQTTYQSTPSGQLNLPGAQPWPASNTVGVSGPQVDGELFPQELNTAQWTLTLTLEAAAFAAPGGNTVTASFGDTLSVADFAFYDAQGNLLPGIQVSGASGANYTVLGSQSVPEPSSLTLVVMGGICSVIGACLRRRASAV